MSDWSSDVCSSDLASAARVRLPWRATMTKTRSCLRSMSARRVDACARDIDGFYIGISLTHWLISTGCGLICAPFTHNSACFPHDQHYCASHWRRDPADPRSEEHTSELQSLMRRSYAVS